MKEKSGNATRSLALASALTALIGVGSGAQAAAVINGMALVGADGDTLTTFGVDNINDTVRIDKLFMSLEPVTVRFSVGHTAEAGDLYTVNERITNNSGTDFTDYHISIVNGPDGVTFDQVENAVMQGSTLDAPPASGPRNLNFTGNLGTGGDTQVSFMLAPMDPGAGNSYTFDLVQAPTTAPVPVPAAVWLLGTGLCVLARRGVKRTTA